MDVVLGSGWPGVMLHEAVGHGLEGDFNRKQTSAFAGLMGQQVAAKGVTVVDDGTIASRRGSLSIDDEGTPTNRTVLIEDGVLVGYMQDRQNARLMNMKPTGNGRRQGYAHVPMPRMTNTYMLAGGRDPGEILASVKNGIYAANFGGGQVDITSGKYVFQCTEAYRIENGKIGAPLKGAMLIGNGPTDLHRITMIGNDLALDTGIGTCGKNGQGVPVGVGQPTLRIGRPLAGLGQARRRAARRPDPDAAGPALHQQPCGVAEARWDRRSRRRQRRRRTGVPLCRDFAQWRQPRDFQASRQWPARQHRRSDGAAGPGVRDGRQPRQLRRQPGAGARRRGRAVADGQSGRPRRRRGRLLGSRHAQPAGVDLAVGFSRFAILHRGALNKTSW